jgi:serine/threonine protein phosphatase PrpC
LRPDEVVVLATDGFVDFSSPNGDSPESAVARQLEPNLRAGDVARRLVEAALELGAADAVSVAVAVGER